MGEKTDQVKGRVKEVVGEITDNDELKHEGQADRLAGDAKEKVEDAAEKVDDVIDKAKDALQRK
jgi:uncharacterized protein YjbJ (UPF0337 family)